MYCAGSDYRDTLIQTYGWTITDGGPDDFTAPTPDISILADVVATCDVTSLSIPTATDNCSGTVQVTSDAVFPITEGTTVVTWTYDDGHGNTVTQAQNVIVDDVTAPVSDSLTLPDILGECEITNLNAPTATDNCASSVTVTNDAILPITTVGTTVVTWTFDDGHGNTATQMQNVIVYDATPPVANASTLPDILAACEITSLTAPTATDNCASSVMVTNDAVLPITEGTTVVTWTYDDGHGNTTTQTQNVIVDDATAPVADSLVLPDILAACEITSLIAPTATDNCAASVIVTNDAVLPITEGTTVVTWTYDDGHGNTTTQTQNVIVDDATAPAADSLVLPDILAACEVTSLIAPTATDNCAASVIVTNDAILPITTAGTTVITWTYDDGHGNTATQTQNVVITDVIAPVADSLVLPDILAECEVTSLIAPTATDNCASSVIVTNDVTLPITTAGTTVVTWTYDDGHGNTSTQMQNVILQDVTPPTASNPDTLTLSCISDVPAPNAVYVYDATDNCSTSPTITWMNDVSDGMTCPETITRTYRVEDAAGLFVEVYQTIIVNDDVAPVLDSLSLTTLTSHCPVTPNVPTATDNCSGMLNGVADVTFPISTVGVTTVTWTFTDNCGNASTQTQEIIIEEIETGTLMAADGITIVSSNTDADATFQWVECHNNYAPIAGETNQSFTPTYGGDFAVIVTQNGCSDTSDCVSSFVGIKEVYLNEVLLYPNPSNGNFTVQSEHPIVEMILMDLSGRTVPIHTNLTTGEVQCELVATGNYLLQVHTAHTNHTIEVMIH